MTVLTPTQIEQYAYQAGFRGADLVKAVAVSLSESGGNPQAYNPEVAAGTAPGSGSRGLWQIYGSAHPEYNSAMVFDPAANAAAAFAVYSQAGNKFTPWSSYNNGSAQKYYNALSGGATGGSSGSYMPEYARITQSATGKIVIPDYQSGLYNQAATIVNSIPSMVSSGVQTGLQNAATNVFGSIDWKMIVSDWAFILGGAALVIVGLVLIGVLAANSDAGKSVINAAGDAAGKATALVALAA